MNGKILIIEDEPSIADNILYALSTEGLDACWCASGTQGMAALSEKISLVILDVGLPDMNGFELAREIRKRSTVPIIFVTARSSEIDRVVGLEIGGDDYVTKPFSPRELTARVRAVLRRTGAITTESSQALTQTQKNPFVIDEVRRQILFMGRQLELSRYEFRLLRVLVQHPGRVFTRAQLMDKAWDEPDMSLERTVDTHIKTIRRKLQAIAEKEEWILTHRGTGYSLKEGS